MAALMEAVAGLSLEETQAEVLDLAKKEYARWKYLVGREGKEFKIVHLHSARGDELNGQRGVLIGVDPFAGGQDYRLHLRTRGGEKLRLKSKNLLEVRMIVGKGLGQSPELSAVQVAAVAQTLTTKLTGELRGEGQYPEHFKHALSSMRARYDFMCTLVDAAAVRAAEGEVIPCQDDFRGVLAALPPTGKEMLVVDGMGAVRPACYGDGYVRLARLAEGLIAPGGQQCAVCLEEMVEGTPCGLLPCAHKFHPKCATQALAANKRECPVCRLHVGGGKELENSYLIPPAQRVLLRFHEWINSGFCEHCQMAVIEKQQLGQAKGADGSTVMTVDGLPCPGLIVRGRPTEM